VTDSKTNLVKRKHVLEPNEYWKMIKRVGRNFDVASGAKAAMPFLQDFDLEEYVAWLNKELTSYRTTPRSIEKKLRRDKIALHLKHLQPLLDHQCKPEWQLLTVLPVVDLPELEEQYQKIEEHCKRMRMFIDGGEPSAVIEDWSLQLQRKIDELMKTLVKRADSDYERLREYAPGIIKRNTLSKEIASLRDIALGFGLKISEWEEKPDAKMG
jgi:DNA-directed RNA polymerase beta' subunit